MSDSPVRSMKWIDAWLMLMGFAALTKAQMQQFCGIPPRLMSPRQFARSRGYSNASHMARVAEERARATEQAGGIPLAVA